MHDYRDDMIDSLRREIDRLRAMVATDTGTWQDLWTVERAANDKLRAALARLVDDIEGGCPRDEGFDAARELLSR